MQPPETPSKPNGFKGLFHSAKSIFTRKNNPLEGLQIPNLPEPKKEDLEARIQSGIDLLKSGRSEEAIKLLRSREKAKEIYAPLDRGREMLLEVPIRTLAQAYRLADEIAYFSDNYNRINIASVIFRGRAREASDPYMVQALFYEIATVALEEWIHQLQRTTPTRTLVEGVKDSEADIAAYLHSKGVKMSTCFLRRYPERFEWAKSHGITNDQQLEQFYQLVETARFKIEDFIFDKYQQLPLEKGEAVDIKYQGQPIIIRLGKEYKDPSDPRFMELMIIKTEDLLPHLAKYGINGSYNADFLLIRPGLFAATLGELGYKGIRAPQYPSEDTRIRLGRNFPDMHERFAFSDYISRTHCGISPTIKKANGQIIEASFRIQDLFSTNGTYVKTPKI